MKKSTKVAMLTLLTSATLMGMVNVKATETTGSGTETDIGTTSGTTGSEETELRWTDFSNAKLELVNEDGVYRIDLKGITPISGHNYYLYFLENANEPSIEKIKEMYQDSSNGKEIFNEKTNYLRTSNTINDAYIQNKDLYMTVVETQVKSGIQHKVGKFGIKLERTEMPKYSDAFKTTIIGKNLTQIITHFPMDGDGDTRKMTIKIGKITDNEILKKIKNKDKVGFQDLLKYSKNNSSIYNEKINIKPEVTIRYSGSSATSIDIDNKIVDGNYYFLYVEVDNENGKYIAQEAVTLAKGWKRFGDWALNFYGTEDFNMDDFTGGTEPTQEPNATPTPNPTPNPTKKPDDTTMKNKLPQTGTAVTIGVITGIATISGAVFYVKSKKYKI